MTEATNPYIAGNPVGGSPAFVGRETILRSVLRMLESAGENALVLYGQRRIGKTSVLLELAERLRHNGPYHPIYFDLQDKATQPLTQVVGELAQRLAAELDLSPPPDWGTSTSDTFRQQYLPSALQKLPNGHSLVMLFDEFDVMDAPAENQAGAAFFPYLRDLLDASPRLQFVFVIGRRPEDLSNLTLSVFKGVRSEQISLLTPEETERLVRLSEADGLVLWAQEGVDAIYALTGGHPFLTQQLCQEVWEQTEDAGKGPVASVVTPAAVENAVPAALRSATNALEWLWGGLAPAERIVASALAGADPGVITQEELERRLQESGVRILIGELRDAPRTLRDWDLIEPDGGGYRFRVELLRRWITERKPLSRVREEIDFVQPTAENLFRAACALHQGGQLDQALPLLQQVVRLNPNHQRGSLLLAEILLTRNQLDEAQQLLQNLYQYSPAAARSRLVQTLFLQAQASEMEERKLELYDQVLAVEPTQREALDGRQSIWVQRGDKALSAGQYENALAAYRESGVSAKIVEVGSRYIDQLEQGEKYTRALELAQWLLKEYPQHSERVPMLERLQQKIELPNLYQKALDAIEAGEPGDAVGPLIQIIAVEHRYRDATSYLDQAKKAAQDEKVRLDLSALVKTRRESERQADRQRVYKETHSEVDRTKLDRTESPDGFTHELPGDQKLLVGDIALALKDFEGMGITGHPIDVCLERIFTLACCGQRTKAMKIANRLEYEFPQSKHLIPRWVTLERLYSDFLTKYQQDAGKNTANASASLVKLVKLAPDYRDAKRLLGGVIAGEHPLLPSADLDFPLDMVQSPHQNDAKLEWLPRISYPELSPKAPRDYFRLFWWLLSASEAIRAYPSQWGRSSISRAGDRLGLAAIWIPSLAFMIALGFGLLPWSGRALSALAYIGVVGAVVVTVICARSLATPKEIPEPENAFVWPFGIGVLMALSSAIVVANSNNIQIVAVGLVGLATFVTGVTFAVTCSRTATYFAGGLVAGIVTGMVTGWVYVAGGDGWTILFVMFLSPISAFAAFRAVLGGAFLVEAGFLTHRPFVRRIVPVILLGMALAVLLWYAFLGGWSRLSWLN